MVDDHEEQVRKRAHALWEVEGRPEGRALDHWLAAKNEADSETSEAAHPDDVDQAAGPSHGDADFGGHDAEAEGAAAAGVGGQTYAPGSEPKQAGTDEPAVGEQPIRTGLAKPRSKA